ncbi:MAG: peptidoglycan bridge formation glycyltransferase FemA/FemB family protein [Candidatus Moranbacteria bacterium]|nr:peptidoglycan bridge formation glycyltransferase FemA/FemB family protein [Candidatus Moranbacteria bacterium]
MNKLEKFLKENTKDGGLLQSGFWRIVQEKNGRETTVFQGEGFRALFIKHRLPIAGSYLFCPRGPAVNSGRRKEAWKELIKKIDDYVVNNKISWIRAEPQNMEDIEELKKLAGRKISKAPKNHEPEETLIIDLKKPQGELLSQMKSKTRYNIRLSRRKRVAVKRKTAESGFEDFWKLFLETARRDKINLHPKEHYKNLLSSKLEDRIFLYLAYWQNVPIGGIIVGIYGGTAVYLHGASSYPHRQLMGNYALQWHAMKKAKQAGADRYDLGGAALKKNKKSWQGITHFKKGFCPDCQSVEFPGCYDIIIDQKKYYLYKILRKARSIIR